MGGTEEPDTTELAPQSMSSKPISPVVDDDDDDDARARTPRTGLRVSGVVAFDPLRRRRRAGDEATDHSPPDLEVSAPATTKHDISLIAHMQIQINLPVAGPTSRHSTTYTHSRVPSRTGAHSSLTCDVDVRVATHSPGRSGGVNSNGTISEDTNSTGDFLVIWLLAFGFSATASIVALLASVDAVKSSEGFDNPTRFLARTRTT